MLLTGQAQAIPNPVPSPLNVGSGSDLIAIESSERRIQYAGAARPIRRITARPFGATASLAIGTDGSHHWAFNSTATTKLWLSFGPLPQWVDSTEPIVFKVLAAVASSLTTPNATARLIARMSYQRVDTIPALGATQTNDHNFDDGSGYTASTLIEIPVYTLAADSLQAGDLISATLERAASATEDTIGASVIVYDAPWLEVTQKEVA